MGGPTYPHVHVRTSPARGTLAEQRDRCAHPLVLNNMSTATQYFSKANCGANGAYDPPSMTDCEAVAAALSLTDTGAFDSSATASRPNYCSYLETQNFLNWQDYAGGTDCGEFANAHLSEEISNIVPIVQNRLFDDFNRESNRLELIKPFKCNHTSTFIV